MRSLRQSLSWLGLTVVASGLTGIALVSDRQAAASPQTAPSSQLAQLGLPDIIPDVPDSLPIPDLSDLLEEDPPLTTSLEDVRREMPLLDGEDFGEARSLASLDRQADGSYFAPPGLYEATLQSYCLRAGTHGPGGGDGYAYAPLEGPRADLITKILRESANYPDIPQRQIQILLWGIIAQTRVSDMDENIQSVARTLLTEDEIDELNGGSLGQIPEDVRRELFANLPPQVRRVLNAKAELRARLSQANATYEELENIAVLTGTVPRGEGSREIPEGRWSLHPGGYFVRYFPSGYQQTRMEALVPRPATVVRDDRDRITAIDYGDGYRLETEYDDAVGAIPVPGEPEMNIYQFSVVRLVSPDRTVEVRDRGWTFVGTPTTGNARFSELSYVETASTKNNLAQRNRIDVQEANQRYQDAKAKAEKVETTLERLDEPTREEGEQILDRDHYKDGVEAVAENDPEAKGEWLGEHFQRAQQAWAYAICKISNLGTSHTCGEPEPEDPDPDPNPPGEPVEPGGDGAIPGNTSRQRLGISGRLF
ncbi:hypothetical protein [Baaleninema sp.]|uniref:hypothetical protein n=1 Tax=Baaleninema sp. TaxID=3101197 RepID=UPI003D03B7E0